MSDDFGMSGDDLEQMYQEVILEAARDPHGKAHFAPDLAKEGDTAVESSLDQGEASVRQQHEYCETGQSHQFNPTCGDEATIRVEVSKEEPHRIKLLEWDGHGCSISQASLSVMTDLVEGKTVEEAMSLGAIFHKLMESAAKASPMTLRTNGLTMLWCSKVFLSILCVSSVRCSAGKA